MSLKYDHIIWDWNGTLLDDVGLCLEIINGVL
ncbi:MAG: HAD family hydrolase, partial [Ignavibacteriaceae bacterium]|nr:HAD family hydrolase [Ignavibacteriaceae bacterium]